jgi:hypothetical protein
MTVVKSGSRFLQWGKEHGAFVLAAVGTVGTCAGMLSYTNGRIVSVEEKLQKERELREKDQELREKDVKRVEQLVQVYHKTAKKTIDDSVQAQLFKIQNTQEYAGHKISKHPAPKGD